MLVSSGYKAVSTNRAHTVLDPPKILAAEYAHAGEIRLRVTGAPNRKAILGRIKAAGGSEFGPTISFKSPKLILLKGKA
jgi:hypothetical protein